MTEEQTSDPVGRESSAFTPGVRSTTLTTALPRTQCHTKGTVASAWLRTLSQSLVASKDCIEAGV